MLALKNISIYLRAALLFLLFAVCAMAVFYLPYSIMRKATLEGFSRQETLLVHQAAREIEDFFEHYQAELVHVAQITAVAVLTPEGRLSLDRYQQSNSRDIAAVVLSDASGKITYMTGWGDTVSLTEQLESGKLSLKTKRARVSNAFSLPGGAKGIALTLPVLSNGAFVGDLSVIVPLQYLTDRYLSKIRPGEEGYVWMIDSTGVELYSRFSSDVGAHFSDILPLNSEVLAMAEAMRAGRQGHAVYTDDILSAHRGQPVRQLAVYTPVKLPGNTWAIAVAAPENEALAAVSSFEKWWLSLFVLLFFAFLLYTIFLVRMKLKRQTDEQNREVQEKILENERFLRRFIDSTTIPIGIARIDGRVELLNASVERLYGYTLEDIPTIEIWFSKAYPDDARRAQVMKVWEKRLQETIATGVSSPSAEWTITCKDGRQREVVFSYTLIDDRIVYTLNDVTEENALRRKELQLQEQRARAKKMETIGLMAGGVAHDLNNILSGIVSYPELMLMKLPEDSALRAPLLAIKDSGERAAAVVADLLTVARGVAGTREPADLNDLVRSYIDSPEHLQLVQRHDLLQWRLELDPQGLNISCSPVHIRKCLMNLVTNGAEAVDGEGSLTITTRRQSVDEGAADMDCGVYAVLSVADSGPGIAEQDLEHIFEPFYSRKVMGKSGTGLGLTVVWNTVVDHGGTIRVQSSEQGTTFELFFPVSDAGETVHAEPESIDELQGAGERILVVDDDEQQRDIARQIASMLGYRVDTVFSGEEAVAFIKEQPVDLVILDMVMPGGLGGRRTYEQILVVRPGQKAIIASGFAENSDVAAVLDMGAFAFLKKPYSVVALGHMIQKALQAEQGAGTASPA